jgi:hypothetical protein
LNAWYFSKAFSATRKANSSNSLCGNALKPRAPFTVLIMSEVSRLGREQIETAYALKQLSVACAGEDLFSN